MAQSQLQFQELSDSDKVTEKAAECVQQLFMVSKFRRDKGVHLLKKILSNIINNPNEPKFQSLNYTKIDQKFVAASCHGPAIELLQLCGFKHTSDDRLQFHSDLSTSVANQVLQMLNNAHTAENSAMDLKRQQIIEENKKRLNTAESMKKKAVRETILKAHQSQMADAQKGIYSVKASVSDRKGNGSGNAPNTLQYS